MNIEIAMGAFLLICAAVLMGFFAFFIVKKAKTDAPD